MTWHFNIRKANNFTCKALKTVVVVPPCDLLCSKVITHGLTKKTVTSHESQSIEVVELEPIEPQEVKPSEKEKHLCLVFFVSFLSPSIFFGGKYKTTHWKLRLITFKQIDTLGK